MTESANAAAAPAAPAAPPAPPQMPALPRPPASDYAETQALIREITTEARAANQRLDFDPEAPEEGESENAAQADEAPADAEGRSEAEDPKHVVGEGED